MEAYVYLIFQRKIIKSFIIMSIVSLAISLISLLETKDNQTVLINNNNIYDITSLLQLTGMAIFSFLHFLLITSLKNDVRQLYFERFEKMSKNKDFEWLTCRTLHVSGIAPSERNSNFIVNQQICLRGNSIYFFKNVVGVRL